MFDYGEAFQTLNSSFLQIHRESQTLTWLLHSFLTERAVADASALPKAMLVESERRVRRSLKLVAFYYEVSRT